MINFRVLSIYILINLCIDDYFKVILIFGGFFKGNFCLIPCLKNGVIPCLKNEFLIDFRIFDRKQIKLDVFN